VGVLLITIEAVGVKVLRVLGDVTWRFVK